MTRAMESSDASTGNLIAKNQLLAALGDLGVLREGATIADIVAREDDAIDIQAALSDKFTPSEVSDILGGPQGLATALLKHSKLGPNASHMQYDEEHGIVSFAPDNKFTGPATEIFDDVDVQLEAAMAGGDPLYASGMRAHSQGQSAEALAWTRLNAEILPHPSVPAFPAVEESCHPKEEAEGARYYGVLHTEFTEQMVEHILARAHYDCLTHLVTHQAFTNLPPSHKTQIYAAMLGYMGASYTREPIKHRPFPEAAAKADELSKLFLPTPEILNLKFEAERPSQADPDIAELTLKRKPRNRGTYIAKRQYVSTTDVSGPGTPKESPMLHLNTGVALGRLRDEIVSELTGLTPPALLIEGPFETPEKAEAAMADVAAAKDIALERSGLTTSVVERGTFYDIAGHSLLAHTPQSLERAAMKRKIRKFDSVVMSLVQMGRHINRSNHIGASVKLVISVIRELALLVRANNALPEYSRAHGIMAITEVQELVREAATMSYRFWAPDAELAADILVVAEAAGLKADALAALKKSPLYHNQDAYMKELKDEPEARAALYRELRHISAYACNYFNEIEVVQGSNPVAALKMPLQLLAAYNANMTALIKDAADNEAINLVLKAWNPGPDVASRILLSFNAVVALCGPNVASHYLQLITTIREAQSNLRSDEAVKTRATAEELVAKAMERLGVLTAASPAERLRNQLNDVAEVNAASHILNLIESSIHELSNRFGDLWGIVSNPTEHLGLGPLLFNLANIVRDTDIQNMPIADGLGAIIKAVHAGQHNMLTNGKPTAVLKAHAKRVKNNHSASPLNEFVQVVVADILSSASEDVSRSILAGNHRLAEMAPSRPSNALTHMLLSFIVVFPLLSRKKQKAFITRVDEVVSLYTMQIAPEKLAAYNKGDAWSRHHFHALRPDADDLAGSFAPKAAEPEASEATS